MGAQRIPRPVRTRSRIVESDRLSLLLRPGKGADLTVITASSESGSNWSYLHTTSDTASGVSTVSDNRFSIPNINANNPAKLSSYTVYPSAAYENKSNWKSTAYASAEAIFDVESSDAFVPLRSVAAGLTAVLKRCNVRCPYLAG